MTTPELPGSLQDELTHLIRARVGLAPPGCCAFEELTLHRADPAVEGGETISFSYFYDEDGFSQYDKTIRLQGRVRVEAGLLLRDLALSVDHVGVAAVWSMP